MGVQMRLSCIQTLFEEDLSWRKEQHTRRHRGRAQTAGKVRMLALPSCFLTADHAHPSPMVPSEKVEVVLLGYMARDSPKRFPWASPGLTAVLWEHARVSY